MRRTSQAAAKSAWQDAEAWGVDLALLAANLRRTPAERMRRHNLALTTVLALRKAEGRRHVRAR